MCRQIWHKGSSRTVLGRMSTETSSRNGFNSEAMQGFKCREKEKNIYYVESGERVSRGREEIWSGGPKFWAEQLGESINSQWGYTGGSWSSLDWAEYSRAGVVLGVDGERASPVLWNILLWLWTPFNVSVIATTRQKVRDIAPALDVDPWQDSIVHRTFS